MLLKISQNKVKILDLLDSSHSYRYIIPGLNIKSKCNNKFCIAFNDIIYIQIGYVKYWNLFDHLNVLVCPICKKNVKPDNFGFFKCNYEIEYEKKDDNEFEEGKVDGSAEDDDFIKFNKNESGKAIFNKLVFNITYN